MNSVPFVILAGGEGTRFKVVDKEVSKIIYPVLDKPFVFYLIEKIYQYNVDAEVFVSLHKDLENIKALIEESFPRVKYIIEDVRRGTGGAVQYAFEILKKKELTFLNGDSYIDIDWKIFLKSSSPTICLCRAKNTSLTEEKGNVTVEDGRVIAFMEKSNSESEYINAGIYLFKKEDISDYFKESSWSLENDYLTKSKELKSIISEERLFDIGTPKGLEDFQNYLR